MGALALVRRKLVEGTLPGAANPLVLALSHPGDITTSVQRHARGEEHGSTQVGALTAGGLPRMHVPLQGTVIINTFRY